MIEIQCEYCKFEGDHEDFSFIHEYVDKASEVWPCTLRYIETYIECVECDAPRLLLSTLRI